MVVKVRQAMTVHHSANGRSNGFKLASHLQSGKDLPLKSVTMDRSNCVTENGRHGKHEPAVTYERAGSEESQSSMESLTAGELGFSPGDIATQAHLRRGRAGEEVTLDALAEDYVNRKSRRHLLGGSAASLVDEDRGSAASEDGTDACTRVKFMCSFGGKIFPRPSDGKLRYVGGDTKIIAVNRDTNFHDLLTKMREVYGQNLIIKYQLPDEDLDALVSVSSYEDLQNMMEEYDKLEKTDKSSRLRVFLFPSMENDSAPVLKDSVGDLRNSEQRYVDALNGISEAGLRTRMDTYVSGAPVFAVDNLISMDGHDAWSIPRVQEQQATVPKVAQTHAHDVASHILRGPCGVPVSNMSSRPNTSSAPSSAPTSPPLLSRQTHAKMPVVADMHLLYHQETLPKLGTPFSLVTPEVNYSESENYVGSGASSATASQLEQNYRNETRRGPDSPTRKQLDGGHHDLHLRTEPRRMTESKMLRVGSHGKLSRLAELGDGVPIMAETQQISDAFERHFHQQQPHHQGAWTHGDSSQENYRRPDLLQSTLAQQQGYQQHQQQQPLLLRTGVQGVSSHDVGYRPEEQVVEELVHHMPRSLSSHALANAAGQLSNYHLGSAPSSPRLGYPSRHMPNAQIPGHWAFGGAALPEQQLFGRRKNYGDQLDRFRLSSSPPKFRDNVDYTDEWLLRQAQAVGNSEAAQHEQVSTGAHLGYDSNVGVVPYDLLSRPQVPLYKGQNVFQEKAVFQEHQDVGDGRRHQLPQRLDGQFVPGKQLQQHMHSAQNQRHEFHDPLLQMADQVPGNTRYVETQLKTTDWESDEPRLRGRSRTRTVDDDFHVDTGTPRQKEGPQLHLPETSDELLSSSIGEPVQTIDHAGNANFHYRPGMPAPGAMAGYGHMSRTNHVDSLAGPRYVTPRTNDPDYHVSRGFRAGNNIQDLRAAAYDVSGHQYATCGVIQGIQLPSGHRGEEKTATADSSFAHQLKPFRISDAVNPSNDIRWNGGSGLDDIRIMDRPPGLPTPHMPRVASRLSRPSSTTNIPSLAEDMEEGAHVQPYNVQGRPTNLMDDDPGHVYLSRGFPSSENMLISANAAKYNPTLKADPLPTASTDMFTLEPTTGIVPSSQYLVQKPDLPSIKTTSTQVPSVEDDDLGTGGMTSTSDSSSRSHSHNRSGEFSLEHLAEDMASCVLEPSPTKVSSVAGKDESKHFNDSQNHLKQPSNTAPTVWDNPLDSDEEHHSEAHHEKIASEPGFVMKDEPELTAKSSSDSEIEDAKSQIPRVYSSKNIVDTAAEEAREHGLQTIRNDDLEELRELGSGTFGTVYYGKWRGTDVAIKRIKASCFAGRPSEQERLIADFWREARNLGNLHHPNVVAFYGVVADGPGGTLATVTEYMVNGSLKQVLQKKDRTIDRRKRHLIALDAAFGMEYLHEKKVVHFDLKCENLLVNMRDPHRPICKVGDLGLSKVKRQTMVSGGVRGTLPWMAPELLSNCSNFVTEKVDVFSFGIVMWELLTGEEPYANMHYGAIIGGIVNNTLRPVIPSWCDPRWRSLMERCWASDAASRPSFTDIASELRSMSEGLRPKA